ncbi:hypothetical protein Hanom_Chr12g01101421 [Helianthus anomalus]
MVIFTWFALINDDDFFSKTTSYKVCHKGWILNGRRSATRSIAGSLLCVIWKLGWHTVDKWDSGFPLESGPKKATLTWLRKKYAVK